MSLISCLLNTYPYAYRQVLYQRTFFATDRDHCRTSQVVSVEKWLWGACHQPRHLNPTSTSKGGRGRGDRDVCCEVVSSVYDRRVAFMDYPHCFETRLLKKKWHHLLTCQHGWGNLTRSCPQLCLDDAVNECFESSGDPPNWLSNSEQPTLNHINMKNTKWVQQVAFIYL